MSQGRELGNAADSAPSPDERPREGIFAPHLNRNVRRFVVGHAGRDQGFGTSRRSRRGWLPSARRVGGAPASLIAGTIVIGAAAWHTSRMLIQIGRIEVRNELGGELARLRARLSTATNLSGRR